ncbi:hypothetical protein M885DRAFT_441469 [Pelagophyceae sp. CCMP2097]|nr:hypothetical protein M885DRAFT_441469 [Pelagophyceae sp. CCMP2097]
MHVKALDLVHLSPEPASPTVMCVIYTYSKNHLTSAAAAAQTWLPRCDGALILSDKNDSLAVAVPHEGPEEYSNIWQKTRANWRYVYEYYRDDFDYWIFGGDDLFVVPQNLKAYLATPEIRAQNDRGDALFLGRRFKQNGNEDRMFNSGGAGYVLNKRSLTLLYDALDQAFCQPHLHGFWEDVMVAQCLKKGPARLLPYDTRDARGRERFHPFSPGQHYTYSPPGERSGDWYPKYSIDLKFGDECCSPESVAYHYIKPDLMRQMDAVVFKCPLRP